MWGEESMPSVKLSLSKIPALLKVPVIVQDSCGD